MLQRIRNFSKSDMATASFYMALLSGIRLGMNVVVGKFLVLWLGSAGLFLFGQFQSLILLIQNISTGAIHNGITRFWARPDEFDRESIRKNSVSLSLLLSSLASLILLLFSGPVSIWLFHTDVYQLPVAVLSLGTFCIAVTQILTAIFNAEQRYKSISLLSNLQSASLLVTVLVCAFYFKEAGALYGLALTQIISFLLTLFVFRNDVAQLLRFPRWQLDLAVLKQLGQYSLMAIASTVAVALTQIYCRNEISSVLSDQASGFWESTNRISNLYIFFISFLFSGYFLPRFARFVQPSEIRKELLHGLLYLIGVFILTALFLLPFRDWFISLIFSDEFLAISSVLALQILGDFLKAVSWLFTNYLVALKQTTAFLVFEVLGQILTVILLTWGLPRWGFTGIFELYIAGWAVQNLGLFLYFYLFILREKH
ncbi:MAG TPA: oligosaccharide flippase family protein [Catalimonadaceae bacterium]|nr:oligosaccharide flippase family protein [Catalimonadaceae bacterium]